MLDFTTDADTYDGEKLIVTFNEDDNTVFTDGCSVVMSIDDAYRLQKAIREYIGTENIKWMDATHNG